MPVLVARGEKELLVAELVVAVLRDHLVQRRIVDVRQDVLEEAVLAVALGVGALVEEVGASLVRGDHPIDEAHAESSRAGSCAHLH